MQRQPIEGIEIEIDNEVKKTHTDIPIKASEPSPAPDPMYRRRFRTHIMDDAGGIFLGADASWPSPSLDPLYIASTASDLVNFR